MRRVTITRSKWGTKALRNRAGNMCCLGFCAKSAGIPDAELQNVPMPDEIESEQSRQKFSARFPDLDYDIAGDLAEINDSHRKRHNKEKLIKQRGRDAGIDFRFVD